MLGQGAAEWLDREATQGDGDGRPKLVEDWDNDELDKVKAARQPRQAAASSDCQRACAVRLIDCSVSHCGS